MKIDSIFLPINEIISKEFDDINIGSVFYTNEKKEKKFGLDGLYIACLNNKKEKMAYNLNSSQICNINQISDNIEIFEIINVNLIIDIKSYTIIKNNNNLLVEDEKLYLLEENKDPSTSHIFSFNKYFLRDLNEEEKGNFLQRQYHLAAGFPIYYSEQWTPVGLQIKKYPE